MADFCLCGNKSDNVLSTISECWYKVKKWISGILNCWCRLMLAVLRYRSSLDTAASWEADGQRAESEDSRTETSCQCWLAFARTQTIGSQGPGDRHWRLLLCERFPLCIFSLFWLFQFKYILYWNMEFYGVARLDHATEDLF